MQSWWGFVRKEKLLPEALRVRARIRERQRKVYLGFIAHLRSGQAVMVGQAAFDRHLRRARLSRIPRILLRR